MSKLADDFCVRCKNQKFIVKNILIDFEYYQNMQRALNNNHYLRLL